MDDRKRNPMVKHWMSQNGVIGTAHLSRDGRWVDFKPGMLVYRGDCGVLLPGKGVNIPEVKLTGNPIMEEREVYRVDGVPVRGFFVIGINEPFFGYLRLTAPDLRAYTAKSEKFLQQKRLKELRARQAEAERLRRYEEEARAKRAEKLLADYEDRGREWRNHVSKKDAQALQLITMPRAALEALILAKISVRRTRLRLRDWLQQPRWDNCPLTSSEFRRWELSTEVQERFERFVPRLRKAVDSAIRRRQRETRQSQMRRREVWFRANPDLQRAADAIRRERRRRRRATAVAEAVS